MNRWVALGLLVATGAALALFSPALDQRPMHNDEAVNAIKFGALWDRGFYRYDPHEYHGPTLHYATWAISRLSGAPAFPQFTEARLRSVTMVFGVGLILLLPLIVVGLGRTPAVCAAVFIALSPAFAFYSRYYIHEMLLVFFTMLAIGAGWRYWWHRRRVWIVLAGLGLGLMHATKETFVITLAAMALALAVNAAWHRWFHVSERAEPPLSRRHLLLGLVVWAVVAIALFTSFFTNPAGPLDSVRTYLPWLGRAVGDSPHIHPWHFYLERLLWFQTEKGPLWSEGLIFVLAIVGAVAAFRGKHIADSRAEFVRFLALYSFGLLAAYSIISYKTPWCFLSFWHGMVLLAGVGAAVLVRSAKPRALKVVVVLLLAAGAGHLAWQSWRANFVYAADRQNPYVYAHTSPDILNLAERVESLAAVHPQGHGMVIKVMSPESDYWPLPWYLRRFPNVGWWDELAEEPFAPVMIVSATFNAALDEPQTHLMHGYFALRPQTFFEMYVERDLWRAYIEDNPPPLE
jgi:uncharacterized protein (TIGR03663 family)